LNRRDSNCGSGSGESEQKYLPVAATRKPNPAGNTATPNKVANCKPAAASPVRSFDAYFTSSEKNNPFHPLLSDAKQNAHEYYHQNRQISEHQARKQRKASRARADPDKQMPRAGQTVSDSTPKQSSKHSGYLQNRIQKSNRGQ